MKKIEYYILDVFAEQRYGGNQLAVFLDINNELDKEKMLQIAKEIGFAESTFITKKIADNYYTVRIFTTESEIPFAGHPTLGTSFVIANQLMEGTAPKIKLDLKVGRIEVELSDAQNKSSCLYTMTQAQPQFLKSFQREIFAKELGMDSSIIQQGLPIQEISTGLPFIIVPIKSLKQMDKIKLEASSLKSFLLKHELYKTNSLNGISTSFLFFTNETFEEGNDYNVRMFCIEDEILKEDSATGSANGCFLAYLLKNISNEISAKVEQGFQMNRMSHLFLTGLKSENNYQIKVGGHSKMIAQGQWYV